MKGMIGLLLLLMLIGILLNLRTTDEVGDDMEKSNGDPPNAAEQNIPDSSSPEAKQVPFDSTNNNNARSEEPDTEESPSPTPSQPVEGIPGLW